MYAVASWWTSYSAGSELVLLTRGGAARVRLLLRLEGQSGRMRDAYRSVIRSGAWLTRIRLGLSADLRSHCHVHATLRTRGRATPGRGQPALAARAARGAAVLRPTELLLRNPGRAARRLRHPLQQGAVRRRIRPAHRSRARVRSPVASGPGAALAVLRSRLRGHPAGRPGVRPDGRRVRRPR